MFKSFSQTENLISFYLNKVRSHNKIIITRFGGPLWYYIFWKQLITTLTVWIFTRHNNPYFHSLKCHKRRQTKEGKNEEKNSRYSSNPTLRWFYLTWLRMLFFFSVFQYFFQFLNFKQHYQIAMTDIFFSFIWPDKHTCWVHGEALRWGKQVLCIFYKQLYFITSIIFYYFITLEKNISGRFD